MPQLVRVPSTLRREVGDVTVSIAAPPSEVFAYLVDPRNRPEWQVSLRRVADVVPLGDGPGDVGTSWTDVTVVPFVKPRMEVVDNDFPRQWVETGQWRFVDATLTLIVDEGPHGTSTVRARAAFTIPSLFAPAMLVLKAVVPSAIRADLQSAADRIAERRASSR